MPRAAVLLIAACVAAAGCGGEDQTAKVRGVVAGFGEASAKKDYQRICDDLLAEELVKNLEQIDLPCELALKQGLEGVRDPKLTIGAITVKGARATAAVRTLAANQLESNDTLQLRREGDSWRITALSGPPKPPAKKD